MSAACAWARQHFLPRLHLGLAVAGSAGKTAVRIAQALALATGRPLTGEHVFQRARVLIVCPRGYARRAAAPRAGCEAASWRHHRGGARLVVLLGASRPEARRATRRIAPRHAGRPRTADPRIIAERKINLVILDPLVKTHTAEENDNVALDAVACILARIAGDMNCGVDVLHHERKDGSPAAGDANRGRGASSFRDAARLLYTLTPMTEAEREQFGLSEADRRRSSLACLDLP